MKIQVRAFLHASTPDSGQTWDYSLFSYDATPYGNYVLVSSEPVELEAPDLDTIRGLTVEALRKRIATIRADAGKQTLDLEVQIAKLLCITHDTTSEAPHDA